MQAFLVDVLFGNDVGSGGSNVLPNILMKFQPIKILLQYCHYFLCSEMSSDLTVVCFLNKLGTLTSMNIDVSQVA